VAVAVLAVGAAVALRARPVRTPPSNPYDGLRAVALHTRPEDVGVRGGQDRPIAYGVVMDVGVRRGVATVAGFASGDASLYLSTGAVIGGQGRNDARRAATDWVAMAQGDLAPLKPAADFRKPDADSARFYVLTTRGVMVGDGSIRSLDSGASPLSPLWNAGQNVLAALRPSAGRPAD